MPHPLHLHLKSLLIQNAAEVLQKLQQVFVNNRDSVNEVINLLSRLEKLRKDKRTGLLSPEEENRQHNQLNKNILELIDTITEEEAAAFELANAIFKRILVVCKSAGREEYMRRLFPEQYFKGVDYEVSENPLLAETVDQYNLVVFDNFPHGTPEDPQLLLRYYLEKTKPHLLYFGQPLNLLYQFPEKAYFANSIFSLHARIEEMMTLLKYYTPPGNT